MTITSHGEILASDGWRLEWDVNEGQGKVISYAPGRDHIIEGEITPQYLARRVAMFVRMHCGVTRAEMEL